jgi:hypothetical protein
LLAACLAAFLVGSGVVVLSRAATGNGTPRTTFFDLGFDPTDPNEELLQPGHQVTLEEASATVGFGLIRSQHPLASDRNLGEVWLGEAGATEVGLRYESGLRAYITIWPAGKDPAAFYEKLASETGAGRSQTINGFPAWAVSANEHSSGYPPTAVVDLSIGGVEISLQGDFPLETLIAIAETVSPQPMAAPAGGDNLDPATFIDVEPLPAVVRGDGVAIEAEITRRVEGWSAQFRADGLSEEELTNGILILWDAMGRVLGGGQADAWADIPADDLWLAYKELGARLHVLCVQLPSHHEMRVDFC